jgi:hypothetical protein
MAIKFRIYIIIILSIFLANCGIFSNTQTFQDRDSGFSIKIPKNWEEVDSTSILGDYRSASKDTSIPMDFTIYMDTNTMADMFMLAKIGIPAEYAGLSVDEVLKNAMPNLYSDHLVKEKINGYTVFTFMDTLGMGQAQGGFVWLKDNTLYYAQVRVFNGSRLEYIYKSVRLK